MLLIISQFFRIIFEVAHSLLTIFPYHEIIPSGGEAEESAKRMGYRY